MSSETGSIHTDEDWQDLVRWWRRYTARFHWRDLRKATLAAMFTAVAFIYLAQLSLAGLLPFGIEPGAPFLRTPFSIVVALGVGGAYLWKVKAGYAVEITIAAVAAAYLLQRFFAPDTVIELFGDIGWLVFAGVFLFVTLAGSYVAASLFFRLWRASRRNKILVVALFVIVVIVFETVGSKM